MKLMLPPSTSLFSRALALALLLAPAAAHAQSLPKGYASDESPSSPLATAATTTTTTPAPAMTSTNGDDTSATATAQISTATDDYADTDASALTDFQEPLQGYGAWVTDDTYGTVWVPDTSVVGSDFAPYQSGGYWSLTDDDQWLWVSTYDWGYVPFHYGRWVWISGRGWSWIPGRTYAPSWVVWRTSDYGYVGWAPMPPTWYWYGGSAVYFTTVLTAAYVFCPTTYVFHTSVSNYVVHDKDTVGRIASHSRNYTPANPTAAGTHKASDSASATGGGTHAASQISASGAGKSGVTAVRKPVGPSMKEAGVPDSAIPSKRGAADSRAQLFSKKSTTAKAKVLVKSQRAALATKAGSAPASRAGSSVAASPGRGVSSPSVGAGRVASSAVSPPVTQGARGTPAVRPPSSAGVSVPRVSQPVSVPRVSQPVSVPRVSQPVSRPSQPVSTTPRVSQPVSRPSQPATTAPRASAPASRPSTSAPPRVSAPVSRPSVSVPRSTSTPHVGGGARAGGGHRR